MAKGFLVNKDQKVFPCIDSGADPAGLKMFSGRRRQESRGGGRINCRRWLFSQLRWTPWISGLCSGCYSSSLRHGMWFPGGGSLASRWRGEFYAEFEQECQRRRFAYLSCLPRVQNSMGRWSGRIDPIRRSFTRSMSVHGLSLSWIRSSDNGNISTTVWDHIKRWDTRHHCNFLKTMALLMLTTPPIPICLICSERVHFLDRCRLIQ